MELIYNNLIRDTFYSFLPRGNINLNNDDNIESNYAICMTPRVGSTALCDALAHTRLLGAPDEFFNMRGPMQMYIDRYKPKTFAEYISSIKRNCSLGDVFGFKTIYFDFVPLNDNLILGSYLKNLKYIFLSRKDIVKQAISFALATKRNFWHITCDIDRVKLQHIEYDDDLIVNSINFIMAQNRQWERFYLKKNINPLRIVYEDIQKDMLQCVQKCGDFINGVHPENILVSFVKLAQDDNLDWENRFYDAHRNFSLETITNMLIDH